MSQIYKTGVVTSNNFVEEGQYDKAGADFNIINPNLMPGYVEYHTTKDGHTYSYNTLGTIPATTIEALAGKTLCMSFEICTPGDRYSTEQGQTAWNQIRYGIHGAISIGGTATYPFAGCLTYSGNPTRSVQTWTVPTGASSYGALSVAVQLYDKPASTNSAEWWVRNLKIEVADHATPYVMSDISASGSAMSFENFIEY